MVGPVFWSEWVRSGRRGTRWPIRSLYVGFLWVVLLFAYRDTPGVAGSNEPVLRLPAVAHSFYESFRICQLFTVVIVAPMAAAGALTEERNRATLVLLFASCLTDAEIVMGKLIMAWARVAELVLAGLPLVALCLLLGGVAPLRVFADLLLALAVAWAGSALAVLASVWCRQMAGALLSAYLFQAAWYSLPAVRFVAALVGKPLGLPDWLLRMNAFQLLATTGSSTGVAWADYTPSLAATLFAGAVAAVAACRTLRVAWRRSDELAASRLARRRRGLLGWGVSDHARNVGDSPVLWRELWARPAGGVERATWWLYVAGSLCVLALLGWDGYGGAAAARVPGGPPRLNLLGGMAIFLHLSFFGLPYLAIAGASAFDEERQRGLFDLLRVTDLEQSEVVNAKLVRLLRLEAGVMALPVLLAGMLLGFGRTTWCGFALVCVNALAAGWLAVTLGLLIGLSAARASRGLGVTLGIGLLGGFFIPLGAAMFQPPGSVQHAFMTMSAPVQCWMLVLCDTVDVGLSPPFQISLGRFRAMAALWSAGYLVTGLVLYLLALRPRGPWREAAKTQSRGSDKIRPVDFIVRKWRPDFPAE